MSQKLSQFPGRSLFSSANFGLRRDAQDLRNDGKGPEELIGIKSLCIPKDTETVIADLVFVHGLNGDAFSTWTSGNEAAGSPMWPRDFLGQDKAFANVRIHTFGYHSAVSKDAVHGIAELAQSLLSALHDCQDIPRDDKKPLILIGYGIGGLVIKQAFILSRQILGYQALSKRFAAMLFIATPHQGADKSHGVNRLVNLAGPAAKSFIQELHPSSSVLQSINSEFPLVSDQLHLISFFETLPTSHGVKKGLIVEKHSSVMNYPNERRIYLNANHKETVRFASTRDSSYLSIRNALATFLNGLVAAQNPPSSTDVKPSIREAREILSRA